MDETARKEMELDRKWGIFDGDENLNKAAELFERGAEMSQQLRSELNSTYWTLCGKYGIAQQIRELNQLSFEYDEAEAALTPHCCVECGKPTSHMYCLDCAPDF